MLDSDTNNEENTFIDGANRKTKINRVKMIKYL